MLVYHDTTLAFHAAAGQRWGLTPRRARTQSVTLDYRERSPTAAKRHLAWISSSQCGETIRHEHSDGRVTYVFRDPRDLTQFRWECFLE
jgi:hypothetical protein